MKGGEINLKKSAQVQKGGFTLVELLVVIAIIAILAAVVALILNPLELTRRGRDSTRLTDLANLQSAISVAVQEATGAGVVSVLCKTKGSYPCSGVSNSDSRVPDGNGWVKADISTAQSVSVATLPVDPINSSSNHYTYCANSDAWEIDTILESTQQSGKMNTDGGNDPTKYEVGSNLSLIASSGGICAY